EAGVDGVFYWFDNNWHYLRRWEHFHQLRSPARLAVQQAGWLADLASVQLPASDAVMSRALSMLIKLGWTDADVEERLRRMRAALS
ncbi:MAG: L-glutamine--2-deoxy-scyllo-inosose aminotransferase KanB, partial [Verrucomicrobia bacterium]